MSVTHVVAIRNAIADLVVDSLDPSGYLSFQTSGDVEVARLPFSATAFGAASSGIATAAAITSDTNADGGTIAKAKFFNSSDVQKFACSVTATGGGGDIELSAVVITAGQTVAVSALTYEAPL